MKKLFMIAAVACMATFAQALTIKWTSDATLPFGLTETTPVKLVYTTPQATGVDINDVYNNLGDYTAVTNGLAFAAMPGNKSGTIAATSGVAEAGATYYIFIEDSKGDVYGATFDIAGGKSAWAEVPNPPTTTVGLNFVQVPEPTALALLALGVAGVALRRRRRA